MRDLVLKIEKYLQIFFGIYGRTGSTAVSFKFTNKKDVIILSSKEILSRNIYKEKINIIQHQNKHNEEIIKKAKVICGNFISKGLEID